MTRKAITILVLYLLCISASAQQNMSINLGVERHESWVGDPAYNPVVKINLKYMPVNYIEPGIEFGYSRFNSKLLASFNPHAVYYALKINLHIFPLIVQDYDGRFSLYLNGKYGGHYIFFEIDEGWAEVYPRQNRPDYGVYLGATYRITSKFGIYAEGGYGNLSFYQVGLNFLL